MKRRAPEIFIRLAFWLVGAGVGTALDKAITGTANNPFPMMLGLTLAATLVYFSPPRVVERDDL